MGDLIERDKVKDLIYSHWQGDKRFKLGEIIRVTPSEIAKLIDSVPASDAEKIVRCKDCIHRPTRQRNGSLCFPDETCKCQCEDDYYYSWYPDDNWSCPLGEQMRQQEVNDG